MCFETPVYGCQKGHECILGVGVDLSLKHPRSTVSGQIFKNVNRLVNVSY